MTYTDKKITQWLFPGLQSLKGTNYFIFSLRIVNALKMSQNDVFAGKAIFIIEEYWGRILSG